MQRMDGVNMCSLETFCGRLQHSELLAKWVGWPDVPSDLYPTPHNRLLGAPFTINNEDPLLPHNITGITIRETERRAKEFEEI